MESLQSIFSYNLNSYPIPSANRTNDPVDHSSKDQDSPRLNVHDSLHLNPVDEFVYKLVKAKGDRTLLEKKVQRYLNLGIKPSEQALLFSCGYSIAYDAETLEKFKALVFKKDPELTWLIQMATSEGGLLIKITSPFKKDLPQSHEDPVFQQIRTKVECGYLEEAKKELGDLLESLGKQDLNKSVEGFQLMSEIYLQEGKFPEAAGILWYTKQLYDNDELHKKIYVQLDVIERTLLQQVSCVHGPLKGISQSDLDRKKLKQLRKIIEDKSIPIQLIEDYYTRAKALQHLYKETITKELKTFIRELAEDVIKQMEDWGQNPPCEYALIGLGSLAREEMTPYSDFEFAILINSEKKEDKKFFRLFTTLLHLRFINLGETILPALNILPLSWVFDDITPRGLSFDGSMPNACKTPLGKQLKGKGDYELIHNPKGLSQLQFIDVEEDEQKRLWILQRYHLPSILSACTYVSGSKNGEPLVINYQEEVEIILKTEGKKRAADLMKDDLANFQPALEEENAGKHYNVKKDLYRLPNTMFDGLANYFCLKATSTWERIEELENRNIFTPTAAQDLKVLVMLSQELRLSTYQFHEKQNDILHTDAQKNNLQELYYRALPFTRAMEAFCSEMTNSEELAISCLGKERFYQDSAYYQGIIALRHMDYLNADKHLMDEVIDTLEYYVALGDVKNILGKYKEAENAVLKAIENQPSYDLYLKLGNIRHSAGRFKGKGSAEEAFLEAKKLAENSSKEVFLERVDRELTSFYKHYGDYELTRKCLSSCKEHSRNRLSKEKKEKDSEWGVILDLDLAKTLELEAEVIIALDSEHERAGDLYGEAFHIFVGYYRRTDHPAVLKYVQGGIKNHPKTTLEVLKEQLKREIHIFGEKHLDVAGSYNNIGNLLNELGHHREARMYQENALAIRKKILGEEHLQIAGSYNDLGMTLFKLGEPLEAKKCLESAIKIKCKILEKNHLSLAYSYDNLGGILSTLGDNEAALENHTKAQLIFEQIYQKGHHLDLATCYQNLGHAYGMSKKYKMALKFQKKSLEMKKTIFGEKHYEAANMLVSLGGIYTELKKYQKARKCFNEAEGILISTSGEKHPDVATLYMNKGALFFTLKDYDKAKVNFEKCWEIFQANPSYHLHPDVTKIHRRLSSCYKGIDHKKYLDHGYESNKIEKELDNQKTFQENEGLFIHFLQNKEYLNAYNLFSTLPQHLQEAPQFLCPYMQLAILCNDLTVTTNQKHIQAAEVALKQNNEGSIPTRMKLCLALAFYQLSQSEWNKAYECILHLSPILMMAPSLCFQYELLDILTFNENPLIEGESIPVEILRDFITLKVFQGQEKNQMLQIVAKQLLQKVTDLKLEGHKIEEIKDFCLDLR